MKNPFPRFVGMRYVKTAIAVSISLALAQWTGSQYPLFVGIASFLSMENTLNTSYLVGLNRVLGTVIGAFIGLALYTLAPGNAVLGGIGVVLAIYLCSKLGWNGAASMSAIVVLAIMLNPGDSAPWLYALHRMADTLLGIAVALAINALLFPYDLTEQLLRENQQLQQSLRDHCLQLLCTKEPFPLDTLLQDIVTMETHLGLHTDEFRLVKRHNPQTVLLMDQLIGYREIYAHLKMLGRLSCVPLLHEENQLRLQALGGSCFKETEPASPELTQVYNYHVARILDLLDLIVPNV